MLYESLSDFFCEYKITRLDFKMHFVWMGNLLWNALKRTKFIFIFSKKTVSELPWTRNFSAIYNGKQQNAHRTMTVYRF